MSGPRRAARLAFCVLGASAACTGARAQPAPPPPEPAAAPRPAPDALAPTRLLDDALALLAGLNADGAESSVLFGIPTLPERRRAEQTAARALELVEQARAGADAAVVALEDGLMGRGATAAAASRAAAAEESLARLVDVEQAQRIPFARGWAETILAGARESRARTDAAAGAIRSLTSFTATSPQGESARRSLLCAAMLNSGGGSGAGGTIDDAVRAAITRELAGLDQPAPAGASGVAPPDDPPRRRATLIALALQPRAAAPGDGAADREAIARGLLVESRRWPQRRPELLAEACTVILATPLPAGPERDPARLAVYAKVAAIIEPGVDAGQLPAEAGLARAVTLLRDNADSVEARALLAQVVARADAPASLRAAALWETAAANLRVTGPGAETHAAAALDRFITEYPDDERAPAAARSLEAIAARLSRAEPQPAPKAAWENTQLRALDLLIARVKDGPFHSQLGEWKSRAIVLRARRLDPAGLTAAQLAPLVELEATIDKPRPSPAAAALADLFRRVIDAPTFEQRPPTERLALAEVFRRAREPLTDPRLALLVGETHLQLGQPGAAIAELRPLVGGPLDQPDAPLRPRTRLALVAALRAGPNPAPDAARQEALTLLRQLTSALDESAAPGPRPEWYWTAWAHTLELVAAGGADAPGAENLLAQIKRLELIDPALGGPETAARITAVRKSIGN